MTSFLRPDERSAEAAMGKANTVKGLLNKGLKATTVLGGAALGTKMLPLLDDLVPTGLAIKGISKVFPQAAEFLRNGEKMGLNVRDGMNFIKKNIHQDKNIIQQYSPELFEFINSEMQKGRAPLEAGALAELQPNFKKIIKKMSEDHKTTFASILQTIFGQNKQEDVDQTQENISKPSPSKIQPGSGNAILLQTLQSINQRLGG